jgi:hypothetical protein
MPETPFQILKKYYSGQSGPIGLPAFDRNSANETSTFLAAVHDLLEDHARLIEAHDALAARVQKFDPPNSVHPSQSSGQASPPESNGHGLRFTVPDLDYIYGYVKSRAAVDPGILEILTHRPEIRVKVERQVIHAKGDTMDGRLALLIHEGFFDKPRDRGAVGAELRRRGALADKANLKILSPYLAKLTSYGFLTREGDEFKAVAEMKTMVQKA